jgi:ATP synthase protein I
MTQQHVSGPAQPLPFAAMLHGALIPMVCSAPVIVLVFWITRQTRGGLAALLGVSIAVVFFAGGLHVMKRVINSNPLMVLAGALAVFFGQVIVLGFVMLVLSGADWLDGRSFGLSMLAVALVWQLSQVGAFIRLRKPVYDVSTDEPADAPADEPTRVLLPGQDSGMSR